MNPSLERDGEMKEGDKHEAFTQDVDCCYFISCCVSHCSFVCRILYELLDWKLRLF